ncbi:hypothetical protein [Vibrio sp. TBV020]|uniref:hypothetical protein n=1 Tax=Vibrio sp. TBV020 TaxID=3137398 RepID=UPI0038CD2C93
MAREIFRELSDQEISLLMQKKIITLEEFKNYIKLENSKINKNNEDHLEIKNAKINAEKIISEAIKEKESILEEALSRKVIKSLNLENSQRLYWKRTLHELEERLEMIITCAVNEILKTYNNKELTISLIRQALRSFKKKQNLVIRVPIMYKSDVEKAFPNLIIEEGKFHEDVEIEDEEKKEVHMISIDSLHLKY